jgi:aerobic-type carbon monoxide dehydrogenase small subunit (CoxS/CutS family)
MTAESLVDVAIEINGTSRHLSVRGGETLLETLRVGLGLTGTKEGCVEGECGACTVLLDDEPVDSCLLATAAVDGRRVRTVESLSTGEELGRLQRAFLDYGAVQCGFCTPGFLMTLTALLEHEPAPSPADIRTAIAGNICRCTGYRQMIEAVVAAAGDEGKR